MAYLAASFSRTASCKILTGDTNCFPHLLRPAARIVKEQGETASVRSAERWGRRPRWRRGLTGAIRAGRPAHQGNWPTAATIPLYTRSYRRNIDENTTLPSVPPLLEVLMIGGRRSNAHGIAFTKI